MLIPVSDNKKHIVSVGGLQAISTAMRDHPANVAVQQFGCASLYNIAANNAGKMNSFDDFGITFV